MTIRTQEFIDEEIDEQSFIAGLDEAEVPQYIKKDSYKPKVVDDEDAFDQNSKATENILNQSMKLIDHELPVQIFNGPNSDPKMELKIKRVKQLGGGSQADVYQCRIVGVSGKYVDKTRKIYNNATLAEKTLKQMYGEFVIAKDLVHPNIVKYEYFMKQYDEAT